MEVSLISSLFKGGNLVTLEVLSLGLVTENEHLGYLYYFRMRALPPLLKLRLRTSPSDVRTNSSD
jgi:hypothetical protein